ncbi:hypothetical protein [Flavobacterium sandaracinum]|uniref:Glycosyltransferase RgtA/B/C/D-like domain-containing protein n=1 Tax=Flavobacterium sandaracinum TaxID=2541733 RepID=A0A4R5CZ06_9FLAO|nr:hypothetical protein [Flavobacterium sandaracinum]TDE04760.1 hypothetical protein E0F91_07635 [Flavobacterium sandaracinum]
MEKHITRNGIMINNGQLSTLMNRKLSYSVWEYILRLSTVALLALISFVLLSNKTNALNSFIWSSIAFLIITIFSTLILLKSPKWLWLFVSAYLIKLTIGLVHYLYFIDPLYFESSGGYKALTYEFESVFDGIITFANLKLDHGIFYFESSVIEASHPEILSLISIPFMFFGDYVLTISPINSFFSLLISINIFLISKYKYKFSDKTLKYIALVTAFFPITLLSSLLWRDVVGISFMSIGLTLIYFAKRSVTQYLMLIVACYLFYLHRSIYPILLLLAYVIDIVLNQNNKRKGIDLLYRILTIVFVIVLLPLIINLANTEANESMAGGIFNFNILILPVKILLGIIGPFPWINFLLYESIPAYAYQLQDYFQGTFNIAFVICFILFRKKYFKKENLNLLNLMGLFLIISGLFNSFMHMPYVAFGFMFLTPLLLTEINLSKFKKIYIYSFIALVLLNLIIIVVIGNLGISSLWK